MEDTNREIAARQQAYWMRLSEPERFRRCGEMFALAKRAAQERAPTDLDDEEKKWFVVSELYGREFAEMMRATDNE